MKLAKVVGLAVIAALAMAAIGGASTASATVLCKIKPEKVVVGGATVDVCPEASVYGEGEQTKVKLTLKEGTTSDFREQVGENQETFIRCQRATLGGNITQADQVEGQLEAGQVSFTGSEANPEGEACNRLAGGTVKVTVENLDYRTWLTYEGQQLSQDGNEQVGYGKVHAAGKEGKAIKFSFTLQQFPNTKCEYIAKAEPVQGKTINGSVASQTSQVVFDGTQATFEEQAPRKVLCPDEGKFVASFNVKGEQNGEQVNLYIAKEKV